MLPRVFFRLVSLTAGASNAKLHAYADDLPTAFFYFRPSQRVFASFDSLSLFLHTPYSHNFALDFFQLSCISMAYYFALWKYMARALWKMKPIMTAPWEHSKLLAMWFRWTNYLLALALDSNCWKWNSYLLFMLDN